MGFNFRLVRTEFDAADIRNAIANSLAAAALAQASPTWTLANHDVEREVTRYGGGTRGLDRARAMALVMLALPGAVFIYNGEELGLPNVDLPDAVLQDPVWERSGRTERGRDGCRVPMPWHGTAPPFGFSTNSDTWLPMPTDWAPLTVAAQTEDPTSTLALFRTALSLRRNMFRFTALDFRWLPSDDDVLVFLSGGVLCILNAGPAAIPLPRHEIFVSSSPLVEGELPPDAAVWLRGS